MSVIAKPIILDETGQSLVTAIHRQNALLEVMATDQLDALTENLHEIHHLVQNGYAQDIFNIGDQINVAWTDNSANPAKAYTAPLDIVHFGNVELLDGETVPGMFLQWHYASPYGVQFSQYQAFWVNEAGSAIAGGNPLPAGTYNVRFGINWGSNVKSNTIYKFTTTKAVPVGGMLTGFERAPDVAPTTWRVKVYDASRTLLETVTVESTDSDTDGTNLGTFLATVNGELNSIQRVAYGDNNWSRSAVRQYLKSSAAAGAWWTPQSKWDMAPNELASRPGFLKGFTEEFLSCIQPVKIQTASNTFTDGGVTDVTYDKVWLPSLEQIYCTPQARGIEGDYWEYWKRALEIESPAGTGPTNVYDAYKIFGIDNKSSAVYCRLRSAGRGYANGTWYVNSAGYVGIYSATYANRFAPACVIC